jgi:hypothetical protein
MKASWIVVGLMLARTAMADPPAVDRRAVVITVDPEAARLAPPSALRRRVEDDLCAPVLAQAPEPPTTLRGVLTIAVDASCRIVISYRDAGGNEIHRTVAVTRDPAATVEVIALIAGNLVRDEADEILAELAPPMETRQPPPAVATEPSATVPQAAASTILIGFARERGARSRAASHPWSLGTLAYFSSRSAETVYTPGSGLFLSRTVSQHFSLGATDLIVAPVAGRMMLSGGPFIEGFWFAKDWLQLFGQLGLPMQGSWGGNRDSAFGAQPFLGGGLRVWIGGHTSVAAGARVAIVASSAYGAPPAELVQGTVSMSGGLEIGFHL